MSMKVISGGLKLGYQKQKSVRRYKVRRDYRSVGLGSAVAVQAAAHVVCGSGGGSGGCGGTAAPAAPAVDMPHAA